MEYAYQDSQVESIQNEQAVIELTAYNSPSGERYLNLYDGKGEGVDIPESLVGRLIARMTELFPLKLM